MVTLVDNNAGKIFIIILMKINIHYILTIKEVMAKQVIIIKFNQLETLQMI